MNRSSINYILRGRQYMNIETASRLVELRKSHGLSQDALAEKLGVSRQAVSKWERSEASPDTDNLITLAKLYNISVDELLGIGTAGESDSASTSDGDSESCASDGGNDSGSADNDGTDFYDGGDHVHIGISGIHVDSKDGDHVHISLKDGIHVDTKDGENVHIGGGKINVNGKEYSAEEIKARRQHKFWQVFPVSTFITLVFFVLGAVWGWWHPAWLVFFVIPLYTTLIPAIEKRNHKIFAYPVLVTAVFLMLGFFMGAWHPGWVVFLTIPLYYTIPTHGSGDGDNNDW